MNNKIQDGRLLTVTAPEDLDSGELCVVGSIAGVAATSASSGDQVVLDTEGVFSVPKETSLAISQGDKLYFDATSKKVDKTPTNGKLVAVAVADAGSSDTTVKAFVSKIFAASREGAQGAAVADIATADGSDAATTQALANATKTKVNALLAQLRVAGVIVT